MSGLVEIQAPWVDKERGPHTRMFRLYPPKSRARARRIVGFAYDCSENSHDVAPAWALAVCQCIAAGPNGVIPPKRPRGGGMMEWAEACLDWLFDHDWREIDDIVPHGNTAMRMLQEHSAGVVTREEAKEAEDFTGPKTDTPRESGTV